MGATYLVVEASPDRIAVGHDRRRPGLNHLAFQIAERDHLDGLVAQAPEHGWTLMFTDRHPRAGGPNHTAGYLEDIDGFEVELVVISEPT